MITREDRVNNRFYCDVCERYYEKDDIIIIDIFNTVMHTTCVKSFAFEIKDRGTYGEMVEKYDFFKVLRRIK